jgi:hypothetical protein
MPVSLYFKPNISLKKPRLTVLLLLLPCFVFSQSLSGLWTGVMTNDSSSARKDQSFEIALTEYRGKVYGYSRSEFIVNDTLYYIMKRVKGTINGNVCEVVDDEIISCNFLNRVNKGVKVTSTFVRNRQDSTWHLTGKWATNQTKKYYTVTGKVSLEEEKDLSASKIFPHLEELNKADDVAFYKERKKEAVVMKTVEPENKRFETLIKKEQLSTLDAATVSAKPDVNEVEVNVVPVSATQIIRTSTTPVKSGATSIPVKTDASLSKAEPGQEPERLKSGIKTEELSTVESPVIASGKPDAKSVQTKTVAVSPAQVMRTSTDIKKPDAIPVQTKTAIAAENKIPAGDITVAVSALAGRKSEFAQVVNFKSDSLQLALYDNGEIDGDTVSIFMNGEVIMPRQGLKASAIRKTIYITPGNEEFTLVLYADNLGKYPPNTGLLVVHDGDDVYNIRFSADLQKNAGVVFRRKK